MFINTGNIEVTLPPDVPGHTIYFKRMNGGYDLREDASCLPPGGKEMSSIDLDYASGLLNVWAIIGLCFIADNSI